MLFENPRLAVTCLSSACVFYPYRKVSEKLLGCRSFHYCRNEMIVNGCLDDWQTFYRGKKKDEEYLDRQWRCGWEASMNGGEGLVWRELLLARAS